MLGGWQVGGSEMTDEQGEILCLGVAERLGEGKCSLKILFGPRLKGHRRPKTLGVVDEF